MNGVIGGIIGNTPTAIPKQATPQRVRVSAGVTQGLKIKNVTPVYPQMAKIARVQGPVVLAAIIGKDGSIQNLRVLSTASPLLNQSAIDAVREWRYRPYILNGEPVEVDTQITVNFTLSGG
jgi:periplasmic protein TonB